MHLNLQYCIFAETHPIEPGWCLHNYSCAAIYNYFVCTQVVFTYSARTAIMLEPSNWFRFKACFYLTVFLLTSPFYILLTPVLWICGNLVRALRLSKESKLLDSNLRRTVLVTDTPNTKTLNVLRVLGKAGHRILLVDSNQYKNSGASWSKYVTRTIYVSHHNGPTQDKYIDEVVQVALKEKVDWFIPISKTRSALPNYIVEEKLAQLCPQIRCFGFGDIEIAKMLDHKADFLVRCKELGLSVPDHRVISGIKDLQKLREQNLFEERHYFLKPVANFSEDRLNFTRIPQELRAFNEYVKEYEHKFISKDSYFVCEFIKGSEYTSNVVCRDGQVFSLEVLPTSCHQMEFDVIENNAVREWTLEFCRKTKISSGLCFDFMQDDVTGAVYCIECNPRLHSSISLHHCNPKLATAFQAALEPESVQDGEVKFPIEPPKDSPRVYWMYLEFHKLFFKRQGLGGFLWTLLHGRDAVYDNDDPLPFLISNTLHPIVQLTRNIMNGAPFGIFNPVIGRVSR